LRVATQLLQSYVFENARPLSQGFKANPGLKLANAFSVTHALTAHGPGYLRISRRGTSRRAPFASYLRFTIYDLRPSLLLWPTLLSDKLQFVVADYLLKDLDKLKFVGQELMKLRLLYHGHCFDGVASAAVFTRFYRERIHPEAEVNYGGLLHRPGNLFDLNLFDGDENAIVDFKYAASDKLTWWFDHHQSAFLTPEDEAHFRADKSGKKFLDATRKSCTEFIADVAHSQFGYDDSPVKSLVNWAHIIDGALYESAAQCVELKEPALQLMQVIEADPDDKFVETVIRELTVKSLDEVATSEEVQRRFQPILKQHLETLEAIRRKAVFANGVVQFDLVDEGYEGFNKFIPYYLYPDTTYSVALTRGSQRTKISVGSNPWSPRPRIHNIAKICERYGGGGHAVVGAISLKPDEVERGREVVTEIVEELSQ
jgi:hypothetical protein